MLSYLLRILCRFRMGEQGPELLCQWGGGGDLKQKCLDPMYWNTTSKNKKNQKVSLSLKLSERNATFSV